MLERSRMLLKRKADEVMFVELKEGKTLTLGEITLDERVPLPIRVDKLVDKVKGVSDTDFTADNIAEGMCWTLGFDPEFPHAQAYKAFLTALMPGLLALLEEKVEGLEAEEKWLDAVIYLHAAAQIAPDQPQVIYNLARCALRQAERFSENSPEEKQLEEDVFDLLSEKIEQFTDFAPLFYLMGFQLVNRKSYKAAESAWRHALQLGVDDNMRDEMFRQLDDLWSRIQYEEGYMLVLEGFSDEGLVKLLPLESSHDDWWNLLFFIGLAYRQKAQYDEALDYFRRAQRLNTGSPEIHNEIGLCLMSLERFHEAEAVYTEAIKMHPESPDLLCNKGIALLHLGDAGQARKLIERAYELNPEDEVTAAWIRHLGAGAGPLS
ncbi:tetratricopeptide repeat protein [Acidaminobacter hydrogenoformans]|uniref:Tetratricopeptide repeat-containing protein n=1 Tax=Acidaminobacter hydrogenoformans DSM 2784 TaxID=1120920 RepID=A0A1G5RTY6_9FIRM|nr:tetratricopeptide repeat protein [Acidaminobacter hydrogenoformans]SCZ77544.1 Tetratricopeptide repeat-containing protein [Acidaminobacter hydrogenoformans DSM 2784]